MNRFDMLAELRNSPIGRHFADDPLGFIDIGARGEIHPMIAPLGSYAKVLGFEPDEAECRRLMETEAERQQGPVVEIEPVALGAHEGEAELHLLSVATNHSLLAPNTGYVDRYDMVKWREIGRQPLRITTLDQTLFGSRIHETRWGEILKLDTQGSEVDILAGAARTLRERCVALVTEVSFCQLYDGQALFAEIELLLRRHGFAFYGLLGETRRSRRRIDKRRARTRERLTQADAVFFKDPLPGGPADGTPLDERQWVVLFVAALLLEYHDFAIEIAEARWGGTSDGSTLVDLVAASSAAAPQDAVAELVEFARQAVANPGDANIIAGRLVDRRRDWSDVRDIADTDG